MKLTWRMIPVPSYKALSRICLPISPTNELGRAEAFVLEEYKHKDFWVHNYIDIKKTTLVRKRRVNREQMKLLIRTIWTTKL